MYPPDSDEQPPRNWRAGVLVVVPDAIAATLAAGVERLFKLVIDVAQALVLRPDDAVGDRGLQRLQFPVEPRRGNDSLRALVDELADGVVDGQLRCRLQAE